MRRLIAFALLAVFLALAPASAGAQGAMRFSWGSNGGNCGAPCNWIAADGTIGPDTPKDFSRFIGPNLRPGELVFLNSPGGSLTAALEFGRQLRHAGVLVAVGKSQTDPSSRTLEQVVPGFCLSACVFAFMGGAQRFYDDGGQDTPRPWWGSWWPGRQSLGVHQFYIDQTAQAVGAGLGPNAQFSAGLSLSQIVTGALVAYAIEMGVDPRVLTLAAGADPDGMHILSRREAADVRLSNAPEPLPSWSLQPSRGGLAAVAEGGLDVRRFEARIACRPGAPGSLSFTGSMRVDFGQSNVNDPQRDLRAGLRPVWRVRQSNGKELDEINAPLEEASHRDGISIVAVTIGPAALEALRRGKQLELYSGLPRATGFLFMPIRFDLPDAAQIVQLLQKNCPR